MDEREFLKEETVCGYRITEKEKKTRYVQLKILEQIMRICEKHGLTYYAAGGTLIGAIRHGGYIPWDDDIDVSMMRPDFNRFCEVAPAELEPPYFFRTSATDPGFFANSIYVTNRDTTCVLPDNPNNPWMKFAQGISVGITVMDRCSPDIEELKKLRRRLHSSSRFCNLYAGINPVRWARLARGCLKLVGFDPAKAWKKQHRMLTAYDERWKDSDRVVTLMPIVQRLEKVVWYKEDFAETVKKPFEFLEIDVPAGYDRILTGQFGNYMEFPPEDQRVAKHHAVFEPEIPYRTYCREHYGTRYE